MAEFSQNEIQNREHIAPDKTGDNIAAKKVAAYGFSGSAWQRQPLFPAGFITSNYDYFSVDTSGSTSDVYTYKTGGSGGTLVATLTVTYTDTSKATLSSVARS